MSRPPFLGSSVSPALLPSTAVPRQVALPSGTTAGGTFQPQVLRSFPILRSIGGPGTPVGSGATVCPEPSMIQGPVVPVGPVISPIPGAGPYVRPLPTSTMARMPITSPVQPIRALQPGIVPVSPPLSLGVAPAGPPGLSQIAARPGQAAVLPSAQLGQSGQLGQLGQPGQPGQLSQLGQPGQLSQLGQPGQPGQLGQRGVIDPQTGLAGYGNVYQTLTGQIGFAPVSASPALAGVLPSTLPTASSIAALAPAALAPAALAPSALAPAALAPAALAPAALAPAAPPLAALAPAAPPSAAPLPAVTALQAPLQPSRLGVQVSPVRQLTSVRPMAPVLATPVPVALVPAAPVPAAPVPVSPVLAAPVPAAPVLAAPVPAAPVLAAPVLAAPTGPDYSSLSSDQKLTLLLQKMDQLLIALRPQSRMT